MSAPKIRRLMVAVAGILMAAGATRAEDWSMARSDLTRYVNRTLNKALLDVEAGHWAQALRGWQILAALEPDSQLYAQRLQWTRAKIQARIAALTVEAAGLAQSGKRDEAIARLLDALILDPTNAEIAASLREVEAQRVEQQLGNRTRRVFR